MNARNNLIAAVLAAGTLLAPATAAGAHGTGFSPWSAPRLTDRPDAVQADIAIRPWGVSAAHWPNAGRRSEAPANRQAVIRIRPWYQQGAI